MTGQEHDGGRRADEAKILIEEAAMGGMIGAALGLMVAAALMPAWWPAAWADAYGWITRPEAAALLGDAWGWPAAAVTAGLLAAAMAAVAGFWRLGWQAQEWHYQGAELITDYERGRAVWQADERALMTEAQRSGQVRGLVIGGVELARRREAQHIAIAGLPGSGKTVLFNAMLAQILARPDRAILHDPKGDYTAALADPAEPGRVVLLGPWDARAAWWDIGADVTTPEQATQLAAQMFPEPQGGGSDPIFTRAARALVAGIVQSYMADGIAWSWDTLARDLTQSPAHIIALMHRANPITRQLIDADPNPHDRTAKSFLATVAAGADWIPAYAAAFDFRRDASGELDRAGGFSMRRWLLDEAPGGPRCVILNNNADYAIRAEAIFGALLAAAASALNSPAMRERDADAPGLWLLLDEAPQLGAAAAAAVAKIEELGRSKGVRVVRGVQDESQIMAASGREKGEAQRSVQQTRIYCALAQGSADELSRRLGQRDVKRVSLPQAVGGGNKRADVVSVPVLRAADVMGLGVMTGWPGDGVDCIVHAGGVLVRIRQVFGPRVAPVAEPVLVSHRWERGILGAPAKADAATPGQIADTPAPELAASDLPIPGWEDLLGGADSADDAGPNPAQDDETGNHLDPLDGAA